MSEVRSALLATLHLSPGVRALASGEHPGEEFRYRCGPPRRIDRPGVPLWECGHSIVIARPAPSGPVFALLDAEGGEPEAIARSEQGILFWLFSYLIEDRDWHDPERDAAELREAAEAVGFRSFDEVDQFQGAFGSSVDYPKLLRGRASAIPD